ncbi:pyruvate kinase [Candidatus Dojkabacteria bacterium]|uniref:Pyruvate kinase n=1 Tax=Candidatus Dojkabacteria bacterium TaxID=2099670 RepID=A0A955L8D9_9BACT|nr:pyruvate kinase [Candidatus Dojkabacteria bacterium]
MQKTKIVCTIGPSSWDPKVLKKMIENGMNVARINAAYSDVAELERVAKLVRSISKEVALMLDIKGSDVRLNDFGEAIELKKGQEIIVGNSSEDKIYPKNHLTLYKDVKKGQVIFFDDGSVKAEITGVWSNKIHCKILEGKVLKPGKSMNTPGIYLSIPTVTTTDKEQIEFAIKDKWDFVAASYIRDARDAREVKKAVEGTDLKIIAKIEEGMGVSNIDEILEIFDGIMVARGDMGVELPFEKLPVIQKELIRKCNEAAKPVITATQVLDSMIKNPSPTRAEISDVANAIWDGTDAIMTSGETSAGEYPAETVETISRIAREIEQHDTPSLISIGPGPDQEFKIDYALANAAFDMCISADVTKVLAISRLGQLPRLLARYDLPVPIYTLVQSDTLMRQLHLTKGIKAFKFNKFYKDRDSAIDGMLRFAKEKNLITKDDRILIVGRSSVETFHPNLFEYIDMREKEL